MDKASEKKSGTTEDPMRPVMHFNTVAEQQLSERTEQLAHVVNRLLAANRQLENEIRERTAAEEQLREKMEALEASLAREKELGTLKTRFITLASHEFRTPLSTILSSASLAGRYAEAGNPEKRDQHLEKIRTVVARLTETLHDFLTTTELEENRMRARLERFDFCALVQEAIEAVKNAERPNLEIIFEREDKPIEVFSDRHLLLDTVQNLLTNASRYSKTTVKCNARLEGEKVFFTVADKGIGIPQHEQKHIFERFFRASNASNLPGMGLGLHISKRFLELLGGDITFDSREGQGTTFTVTFC